MIVLAIQHPVKDYAAWKTVFDEYPPKMGGATFHRVNRMVGSPNTLAVVSGFESVEAANAFMSNPGLKDAMDRAGVTGEPRIEMYEQVEFIEY